MPEYLLLLKLDKKKLLETIGTLRSLPKKPSSGVDLEYVMNVLGSWDVAVWFSSDNSSQAIDFVNNKIGQIPGVADAFPVATFPHIGSRKETLEEAREETEEISKKETVEEITEEGSKKETPEETKEEAEEIE